MTSPIRILMVSDVSPLTIRGGAERVLAEQASRLAKRGHSVTVVWRADTERLTERSGTSTFYDLQFPVDRRSHFRFLWSSIVGAKRAVEHTLAGQGSDVLQLYQPLSGYGALRSRRAHTLPCLYTFLSPAPLEYVSRAGMTDYHRHGPLGRAAQVMLWGVERACMRHATRIHVLSDFSASQIRQLYRIPSERIIKIPGGVDTERFKPATDRNTLRRSLDIPVGVPLLLTVRNLEARMGLDNLIRAIGILRRHLPSILLLIGGTGSLRRQLESLADSLSLRDQIRFLGYIPDPELPLYYQAADVFVVPTRELEGFGLITVEALACGTPTVGTNVGAIPEILLSLNPSLVLRDATPEVLAEGLKRYFDDFGRDSSSVTLLRQACRRHAETQYTWDSSIQKIEGVLLDLSRAKGNPAYDKALVL